MTVDSDLPLANPAAIEAAVEAFVGGFTYTRSFTHPYLAERVGPVWVMRDAPRKRGHYRNEEWVAHAVAPEEVDRIAREHTRGRFAICALHGIEEPDGPLRAGYKALGYRLRATEPLMVHDLDPIPDFPAPAEIQRVTTPDLAGRLAQAARSRQVLPEHLTDGSKLRQYAALVEGELVGWVRSIAVGDATWCSNMHVQPEFRRRGIAKSMLSRMLGDDRDYGSRQAVLLSSHTGAMLYPVVGYRQIGTLLFLNPGRRGDNRE